MKRNKPIYLQYTCKDGSRTVAATASMGLLHWYDRILPRPPIKDPRPFEVYVVGSPIPGPYDKLFLSAVVAGLERTFGTAPDVPQHLLDPAHYEKPAKQLTFRDVAKNLTKGVPAVVEYEQVCLDILNWLK